jgi:hypothetical protein
VVIAVQLVSSAMSRAAGPAAGRGELPPEAIAGISDALGREADVIADADRQGRSLMQADGKADLRNRGLRIRDAAGREWPARLETRHGEVFLEVEDARADTPTEVSLFLEQAKLTASDGAAGDLFGGSAAIDGDTIVVGADWAANGGALDRGAADVFVRPPGGWNGALRQQAELSASDGAERDSFGFKVGISGDTVVVSAPRDDIGANQAQGSAYIFVKPEGGWSGALQETAKLTASDGAEGDVLGQAVAISGDTVAVSAFLDDIGSNPNQGSVYVFVRPPGGWANKTEDAQLFASDGAPSDNFGLELDLDGGIIVVGTYRGSVAGSVDQGTAYVFVEPEGGWRGQLVESAQLTASDGAPGDRFATFAQGVSGDTIVVGAHSKDFDGAKDRGMAYVFVEPDQGWSGRLHEQAILLASDGASGDLFGSAVGIDGDRVVVGAVYDDIDGKTSQGSAYLFVRPPAGWSGTQFEQAKLQASDGAAGDLFGVWASMSGDTVVVGAFRDDIGDQVDQGSAYVFDLAQILPTPTPTATPTVTLTPTATPTATPTPTPLSLPGGESTSQQVTVASGDRALELRFQAVAPPIPDGCQLSVEVQPPSGDPTSLAMTDLLQTETIDAPEPGVWTITARSGSGCPAFSYYLFARVIPQVSAVPPILLALVVLGFGAAWLRRKHS